MFLQRQGQLCIEFMWILSSFKYIFLLCLIRINDYKSVMLQLYAKIKVRTYSSYVNVNFRSQLFTKRHQFDFIFVKDTQMSIKRYYIFYWTLNRIINILENIMYASMVAPFSFINIEIDREQFIICRNWS